LFGNPLLINNRVDKLRFDTRIIPPPATINPEIRHGLKIKELMREQSHVKSKNDLEQILDCALTDNIYLDLCTSLKDSVKNFHRKRVTKPGKSEQDIVQFLTSFKKGSKQIRKIFENHQKFSKITKNRTNVKTFLRITNITATDSQIEHALTQWTASCFTNDLKEFCLKFYKNLLGLNTRVNHFNQDVGRGCTFCAIKQLIPAPDESFLHLFFECATTKGLLDKFVDRYLLELGLDTDDKKKKFWFLSVNPVVEKNNNIFLIALSKQILFYIWRCKLSKTLPTFSNLLNDIFYKLDTVRKTNSGFREHMTINLLICRNWNAEAGSRRE
jgi:hypothetical protein